MQDKRSETEAERAYRAALVAMGEARDAVFAAERVYRDSEREVLRLAHVVSREMMAAREVSDEGSNHVA